MKFSMRGEIVGKSAIFGMETAPSDDDPTELKISFLFVDGTRLEHAATYPGDFTEPAPWQAAGGEAKALDLPFSCGVGSQVRARRIIRKELVYGLRNQLDTQTLYRRIVLATEAGAEIVGQSLLTVCAPLRIPVTAE